MQQFVFVSHSSKDKPRSPSDAEQAPLRLLLDALIEAGIKIWFDDPTKLGYSADEIRAHFHRIHIDRPWRDEIRDAHHEATSTGTVLAVWSQHVSDALANIDASEEPILLQEINNARWVRNLVCCRIDASDPKSYPFGIGSELHVFDFPEQIEQLIEDIRRKLEAVAASPKGIRQSEYAFADYIAARVAELDKPEYGVKGELFTPLSLLVPKWKGNQELDIERDPDQYDSLTKIVQTKMWRQPASGSPDEHCALVVLGDPGAGKSTLLRRLEFEFGKEALAADNIDAARFCFFVWLNEYEFAKPLTKPLDWLREQWLAVSKGYPGMPPLDHMLRRREAYLLLDGLNEMAHANDGQYEELLAAWRDFIRTMRQDFPNCRLLFSCRELQYSAGLTTNAILVPHVRVEQLDPNRIKGFLQSYAPGKSEWLYARMRGTPRANTQTNERDNIGNSFAIYNTPYFLKILIDHVPDEASFPSDRAALFTTLVRGRLLTEFRKERTGASFERALADTALIDSDHARRIPGLRAGTASWVTPSYGAHGLPDGHLFRGLASLAFHMQVSDRNAGEGRVGKSRSISVSYKDAKERLVAASSAGEPLEEDQVRAIFRAAGELNLLSYERARRSNQEEVSFLRDESRIRFEHHLIQEYFAGRYVAETGGLPAIGPAARAPWRDDEIVDVPPNLPDREPLPPLSTAWDESLSFAAQMSTDRWAFIDQLQELNLPLAGRIASEAGAALAEKQKRPIQLRLRERMEDMNAHMRARMAAGLALGTLGDHRFTAIDASGEGSTRRARHIFGPTIEIPEGAYRVGSRLPLGKAGHPRISENGRPMRAHANERPSHMVHVGPFRLGKYLVTNAEFSCFMDDGGYNDDRWWASDAAKRWRLGAAADGGTVYEYWAEWWTIFREWLRSEPGLAEELGEAREISTDEAQVWATWSRAPDSEFEEFLAKERPDRDKRHVSPAGLIASFDNNSQPAVGISWYEAQAYCAWLSAQTGERWRLPTEVERETAARYRCSPEWEYPWGRSFDGSWYQRIVRAIMRRKRRPLCNTIADRIRTTTPVGIFPSGDSPAGFCDMSGNAFEWTSSIYHPYPYDGGDGREDDADGRSPRVLRGGSWYYGRDYARIAFRLRYHPGYRPRTAGFRLAKDVT